ncbi:MAG: HNH endonuclease [Saprospiraceae bacterium]|nr:HNH endonuclease [Saprospiraceae bacterium]
MSSYLLHQRTAGGGCDNGGRLSHIKPHALCGINTLDNGLALCPNLHRAFDAGLIGLNDAYKVIVRKDLKETSTTYSLLALKGRRIALPKEGRYWPREEYLGWHRGRWELTG